MSNSLVMGLWLAIFVIAMLPQAVLAATWFSVGLVAIDTLLVTAVIYLSGNARSDLYIAYFVLMLVAASVRRLSHLLGLSLLLSSGYAIVLYEGVLQTEVLATRQLLGIPVLLVMAVFYGEAQEETMPKAMSAKGDETILLVEENEIERKLALSTLQRHRYRVLEAASSVEALLITRQYNGIIHLTVSPLVMPEIGGRELARRLLRQHPTMKTLFVSGYDDETIQHHRINHRFVLQQPYRQSGLIEKVREMLDAA